jgi:hypothetical protein
MVELWGVDEGEWGRFASRRDVEARSLSTLKLNYPRCTMDFPRRGNLNSRPTCLNYPNNFVITLPPSVIGTGRSPS